MSDLPYRRGVGIMLLDPRRRVFVGRRIDTPDAWQMPQGGIDPGETPRQAALRELKEEVGTDRAEIIAEARDWLRYELPPELRGGVWGGRYRGQEQKWFAMRFLGRDGDIDVAAHHPEFDAWKWVPPADLVRSIVPFKLALYEAVLKEFRPILTSKGGG
jgi:putative (di)nucleoside polyphosphate hydrolase